MLNVLQHKHIGDIIVVISRYFGGIKLGAGGLVRAYSSSVQQGIDALPLSQRSIMIDGVVHSPFGMENAIRRLLHSLNITITQSMYHDYVQLHCVIELGQQDKLKAAITETSHGQATLHISNKANDSGHYI